MHLSINSLYKAQRFNNLPKPQEVETLFVKSDRPNVKTYDNFLVTLHNHIVVPKLHNHIVVPNINIFDSYAVRNHKSANKVFAQSRPLFKKHNSIGYKLDPNFAHFKNREPAVRESLRESLSDLA